MISGDMRQALAGITRSYMEQVIEGIMNDTVDVEIIDRVWEACEDLLRTPPTDDDQGSWLYRLETPWGDFIDPEEYMRLRGLDTR